ncbi:MAG: glycosyltransferase [Kiritimatiellia bacterium]|jgi:glycosyltransferase involved in cell wall biosynthesis|nr:glycosyltransferase [Kiritimatiellia bacterium]
MSTPKVAHLVFDLIRGGTEGQCARVAMGLAQRGLSHRVAVFHKRGFFREAVEAACGPVHEVRIRHLARVATVREIRRLAAWLRNEKIDVLHAWDADAAIFGQFAAQWADVKFMTSRRDLGQIYPKWKLAMMRRADRAAVSVVANAEAVREHFLAQGLPAEKVVVRPNLVDLDEFDARASEPFSAAAALPAGRRLVVVNRLDPEKNTVLLIDALVQVRQAVPTAVLIVAGEGRELPALRARAAALGVAEAVCFLGEVLDVPSLLRQCEVGALVPNRNEGLSNTILEYMAASLPVLATDCGGNRELVRDGETGCLLPLAASAADLAAVWIEMLNTPAAAAIWGSNGREQVRHHHAPDAVLAAFAGLYDRLKGAPKTATP